MKVNSQRRVMPSERFLPRAAKLNTYRGIKMCNICGSIWSEKHTPWRTHWGGQNHRKEYGLLSACSTVCLCGLCWYPTNITPTLRCPNSTQQVLLSPLFREKHQAQETPPSASLLSLVLISLLPSFLVQQPSGAWLSFKQVHIGSVGLPQHLPYSRRPKHLVIDRLLCLSGRTSGLSGLAML